METLKDTLLFENNLDDMPELFENLSRELKIIHSNGMIVPELNSEGIVFGESMLYKNIKQSNNFDVDKRRNIMSLAKLMIGTYLSSSTGFKDFSEIDDQWFRDNFESIFSTMNYDNFDKEYFQGLFFEGKDDYYSDYLDRKRQSESLQGPSNVQGYRKVLRNAGSSLYEDLSEEEEVMKEKNAHIQTAFNPLLIGISVAIVTVLLIMLVLVS